MKLLTCGQGVVRTNKKYCQTTRHCREVCWRSNKPACGSDGKIYANVCKMKTKNCGKHVFEVPMAFCTSQERTSHSLSCPISCINEVEKPTCGSDGYIYKNECELRLLNCGNNRRVTKVDVDKCKARLSKCQKLQCNQEQDSICGSDARTYTNRCHLNLATCLKGVQMAHLGNCTSLRETSPCPKNCDLAEPEPVCGSDGNVYRSLCDLQMETCGQLVVQVPQQHCRTTALCKEDCDSSIVQVGIDLSHLGSCNNISAHRENCPVDCKLAPQDGPICGSDGNVYKNTCQMKLLTCGQGVVRTNKKYCQTTRHCREVCWRSNKPACGSDGKIYANVCKMKTKNCGKHVFEVPMAFCTSQERTSHSLSCPISCINEVEKPTCGSDGYIYKNECELRLLNCGNNRRVTKVDVDKCKARLSKCQKLQCNQEQDPICGSDARTYTNRCHLNLATCLKGVQMDHLGNCTSLREISSCPKNCDLAEPEPVYGSDGNMYRSLCDLQMETCGQLVVQVPQQHCRTTALCKEDCDSSIVQVGIDLSHLGSYNNISAHRENCPVDCKLAPQDGPICGSDGNVYKNTCQMKLLTCGQGVVRTNKKYCQTTRHCREVCWRSNKPACGSDGKIYANVCKMKTKNCGKHVFEVPMAFCTSQERTSHSLSCPISCINEVEKPTCGSDGYIYKNECELRLLNCGNNRRVTKVDVDKCKARLSKCQKLQCNQEQDPICGSDTRTYTNRCHLNLATCLKGVQMAHLGNCTSLRETSPCPINCDLAEPEPVCGSDGNVYRSLCDLQMETCGQLVVQVPQQHCRTTALCKEDCDSSIVQYVCGSDNKIYKSECEMKRTNCGKHVFVVLMKRCLAGFMFRGCQKICPTYFDPVCGSDNLTYSNSCFLEIESCRTKGEVSQRNLGTCAEPIKEVPKNYLY